ncbi:nucleoside hydrolase [Spongisporangium articulatum]|uniref:Nucleoside hydrolase n=1 Tax=Spongisporangium articulatum TaxID=3362603 RepID=A0ABW8AIC6_9ACTN
MARSLIIDTDGGVDDCAAIWWALTDPGTDVLAITTTHGSVVQPNATRSVLSLLAAADRLDIPVAAGGPGRFGPGPVVEPAAFIHGHDGQGDTDRPVPDVAPVAEPAEDLLRRLVDERPGEVSVVALAPLTNLARALDADPSWASRVADLVVMGGSVRLGGNALPWGEANIAGDPVAAHHLVAAGWATTPTLVTLDVSHVGTLTEVEFDLMARHLTPAAAFLDEPLRFYRTFGSTFTGPDDCPCHDLLATIAWADPDLIGAPVLPLAVQADGPAAGMTVVDQRAPYFAKLPGSTQTLPDGFHPWRVAHTVDVPRFREHVRTLFGGRAA